MNGLSDRARAWWPWGGGGDGPLPALLVALTVVTGLVDAVSYVAVGHVFVANMTGNVVFLGSAIAAAVVGQPVSSAARYALIAPLALAMGAQNAMARRLAVPDLTTTVLTLTLTGIAADSRLAGGTGGHPARRLISVSAMLTGALAGARLVLRVDLVLPLAIAAVLITGTALTAHRRSATGAVWTKAAPSR